MNKAGPQNHDTVGSVERGVREVKEALAVLRLELAKAGLDLVDSLVAWEAASSYVTAMHNLHGKIQNTGKIGKELLRNTSEGTRFPPCFALGFLQRPQKVLTVLEGLSLLRICILSGTHLLILFVRKLLMN